MMALDPSSLGIAAFGISSAFTAGAAYAGVRLGMRDHGRRLTQAEREIRRAHDRLDRLQGKPL